SLPRRSAKRVSLARRGAKRVSLARHSAKREGGSAGLLPSERSEQIGERADSGQRERDVEPAILRHGGGHQRALKIERLILDSHAAPLSIGIRAPAQIPDA